MSKANVTKRGRPRRYKTDADRQRAYRRRKRAKDKKLALAEEKRRRAQAGRTRHLVPDRIVNEMVMDAMSSVGDLSADFISRHGKGCDRARIPEWLRALRKARKGLNRIIRQLERWSRQGQSQG